MVSIVAVNPIWERLAWMIGAIDIIGGQEETIVRLIEVPGATPASSSSALAFSMSPSGSNTFRSANPQFHSGITPPTIGVACP